MPDLVALAIPQGPALVEALTATWAAGDAAVVLDLRLPPDAQRAALAAAAPTQVLDPTGGRTAHRGRPVDDGDALVVLTSGTTGAPRALVHDHLAIDAAARLTSARLSVDPATDRWLACLPLSHVGGLGVVTRALRTATPLEVLAAPDPAAIEAAASAGATLVSLVPTLLGRIDASRFRTVLLGGAAPPAALPRNVVTTWGMTETFGGVVYDGRPLDAVEVRAVDGLLEVRSPTIARCWRDGTPMTGPERWLATGDVGSVDDDGTVRVDGRLGDVIVTGGEKVWPAAVERALATHPALDAVVVVGRPDPRWGQRVHAVVVAADPTSPPTLAELRDHVGSVLPRWCAPRTLELRGTLPMTPTGKVRRAALADDPTATP